MAEKIFAAIDVGSFEISMKIYEISSKNKMNEIDHVRHRLALGYDSYNNKKISVEKIDELCRVLREYKKIMNTYKVDAYRAYGTSAFRETENTLIIQDYIKNRTGIWVDVLSNSEQRFLDYKSIASKGNDFKKIIDKSTAIIDIGGGNIQVSLFDKDTLVSTQDVKLGVLRLKDRIDKMGITKLKIFDILDEMIASQMNVYKKLYLRDSKLDNLIIVDEYVCRVLNNDIFSNAVNGIVSAEDFNCFYEMLREKSYESISDELEIPEENVELLIVSASIIYYIMNMCQAKNIWAPGVTICDGIAYEYAKDCGIDISDHDFEKDILASAMNISKRYQGSKKRTEALELMALAIFDAMQSVHGMSKRERFLLQLAAILSDCGKFINMTNVGECSYNIVKNTEIIGLSHQERQIIAYVVKFNHDEFEYFEVLSHSDSISHKDYLIIAKLTAILRIAGGLDKSHKHKFTNIKVVLKEDKLKIMLEGQQDIIFEQSAVNKKMAFFWEVYNIEPVIIQIKN